MGSRLTFKFSWLWDEWSLNELIQGKATVTSKHPSHPILLPAPEALGESSIQTFAPPCSLLYNNALLWILFFPIMAAFGVAVSFLWGIWELLVPRMRHTKGLKHAFLQRQWRGEEMSAKIPSILYRTMFFYHHHQPPSGPLDKWGHRKFTGLTELRC